MSFRAAVCTLLFAAAMLPAAGRADAPPALASVTSFGYQLQRYRLADLVASKYDALVVDFETDEGGTRQWTPAEIAALQEGPCGRRIVLAYMSIGEAEDYRFYWDTLDRSVVAGENPSWRGNFKVMYWDPKWQRVVYGTTSGADESYLDRILDQGFDGVYLDIVDAFESWGPKEVGGNGVRPSAAADMVDFVVAIANHARVTRGRAGFLVVPQNGAAIVTPDAYAGAADPEAVAASEAARWFGAIDGIGAEDTFFRGRRPENNRRRPDSYAIGLLDRFHAAGKAVLAIDYVTKRRKAARFYADARARGWVPFASVRPLDRITPPRGVTPQCP